MLPALPLASARLSVPVLNHLLDATSFTNFSEFSLFSYYVSSYGCIVRTYIFKHIPASRTVIHDATNDVTR